MGARLLIAVLVILIAWQVSIEVRDYVAMELMPQSVALRRGVVAMAFVALIVLLAIPFVPGAEIGFLLLTTLGGSVAPWVWGASVLALSLSFLIGRAVPARVTCRGLRRFGLSRAADLVDTLDSEGPRRDVLVETVGSRTATILARHRHLALALALNLPGNMILGGGGGLSLAAGMSRTFSTAAFLVTVALALLPVPMAFLLLDLGAAP